MFALLKTLEDGEWVTLCFASKADAERFKQMGFIYMDESGAGNSYGAYWPYADVAARRCLWIPSTAKTELNPELIRDMLHRIYRARLAKTGPITVPDATIGSKNGAITFAFPKLPERQVPKPGDMFRVMRSMANDEEMDANEGRVLEDRGETLVVVSSVTEDSNGVISASAPRYTVRKSVVLKIDDWLAEHHRHVR